MIHTFKCADTEALFNSKKVSRFMDIEEVARRKLLQLHATTELNSLKVPPDNRLKELTGTREKQHSICINDQWHVCFEWRSEGAHDVEIVDSH